MMENVNVLRLIGRVKNPYFMVNATGYPSCKFEVQTLDVKTSPIPCRAHGLAARIMKEADWNRKLVGTVWVFLGEIHYRKWKERVTEDEGSRFEIRINKIKEAENGKK